MDGTPYFHFTNYGKKMRLLERDNRVCVQIESYRPDLSEYNFVALRGTLKVVSDTVERAEAISRMAEVGRGGSRPSSWLPTASNQKRDGPRSPE